MTANLLPLTGSDKQIAWANEIRAKAAEVIASLTTLGEIGREMTRRGYKPADAAALGIRSAEDAKAFAVRIQAAALNASTLASWWIDRRIGGPALDAVAVAFDAIAPRK